MHRAAGVTLPELLVVLAVVALAVMVSVPSVSDAMRRARLRSAANGLAIAMKVTRLNAVIGGVPIDIEVQAHDDPAEGRTFYRYADAKGRTTEVDLPAGVWIASVSDSPIRFEPNGGVPGGVLAVVRSEMTDGRIDEFRIATSFTGLTTVTKAQDGD